MHMYIYDGPVLEFGKVIADRWVAKTYAPGEGRARCNLAYQFKKQHNRVASAKITLPGKLEYLGQEDKHHERNQVSV